VAEAFLDVREKRQSSKKRVQTEVQFSTLKKTCSYLRGRGVEGHESGGDVGAQSCEPDRRVEVRIGNSTAD